MFDVQPVGPDLANRTLPCASHGLDQVVLVPYLDRRVVDEGIHKLAFEGVADREHLVVDRDDAVGADRLRTHCPFWSSSE